ncbi:MAG TPA: VTT domain-containing protein [Cytophagaceae bacterium]|nr:VTT domain-containing protein [Cytophagaceae bacterium]
MAFALTPTTYIALVSGYFLGWISLTGLIPSYVLASLIGFYLSGKLDKGKLLTYFSENKKIGNVIENLKTNELWVIFFCRISPALPFAMMNVFLAFMKVRMKNFVLGSIVGMLPRTLVSVWIGTQAHDIIKILTGKEEMTKSNLLALILLLFSAVGLYWLFAKAVKKYQQ